MKILVVGAGIVGLNIAYTLNERGYYVEVIDRADRIGSGISGRSAGVLHLIQHPLNSIKAILARLGIDRYRELSEKLGFEIYNVDLNIVGYNILDKLYLESIAYILRRNGFKPRLEKIYGSVNPPLSNKIRYTLKISGYGIVDPINTLYKYVEYLSGNGVEIRLSMEEYDPNNYEYIVVAAGPYTYRLANGIDAYPPNHRYALGVMLNVECQVDAIYTLPPNPISRYTKGGAAIPKGDYTLLGPGFRWVDTPDAEPIEEDINNVYKKFVRLFHEPPEISSTLYGVRPINYPDDDFIIRKIGKYIFTYGIDSPGYTAAPLISDIIYKMVNTGDRYIELTKDNLMRYIA